METTEGEATVERAMTIRGIPHVCVGILGTKKVIAICGVAGADDEAESFANAVKLAQGWNLVSAGAQ